jgi:four helix bundle protein
MFNFENLLVFQKGRVLVNVIYNLQEKFPSTERFALCDQIRRAAVSITSNIAEGMGRFSTKEQIHFIEISFGSLMEVYSQLLIAIDRGYITQEEFDAVSADIQEESKLLSGFRLSLIRKLDSKH